MLYAEGKIAGAISLGLDVTQRQRAEDALRESEDRFHSLFRHMNEIVVLHEMVLSEDGEAVTTEFWTSIRSSSRRWV